MDNYRTLFSTTCWIALVCWLAGAAATNRDTLELTMVREEACVVEMGSKLRVLEGQVAEYLRAYREAIEPALQQMTVADHAD